MTPDTAPAAAPTVPVATRMAQANAVAAPLGAPPYATHLIGLDDADVGAADTVDLLRHAVKLGTVAGPARDPAPGRAWTRWLVWLGAARPPGPPSHVRFGRIGTGTPAGVLLPYRPDPDPAAGAAGAGAADADDDRAALTVWGDPDGQAMVTDAHGLRWRELSTGVGPPPPEDWHPPGWTAAAHHEQWLIGARAGHRVAILLPTAPATTAGGRS